MKKQILLFLIFMLAILTAHAVSISVSIPDGNPHVGDRFYIVVKVSGSTTPPSVPKSVPGAKILFPWQSKVEQSVSMDARGTRSSLKCEYTLTLRAMDKGTYTFGPVIVDGVKSKVLRYKIIEGNGGRGGNAPVTAQGGSPDDPSAMTSSSTGPRFIGRGDDNLFMVASISKTTAYEQEALVYTVKLYSSYSNIRFLGATASPKFDGFVLEEDNPKVESLHFETYKGKSYAAATIARYVIFPQMKGQLRIQGNKYTVTVESRANYYDPFWGNMSFGTPVQLSVQPNDLVINVRPLPTPQPAGFSGAVGKFSIISSLPNRKLATNQASQLIYTVSGAGNLKYITMPDLEKIFPPELEVYSPTTTVNANSNGSTLTGNVKFDYSIMPQEEGDFKIPAVEFVYFNPATGQYEKATAQGYNVTVVKGKASSKSQTRHKLKLQSELMSYGAPLSHEHGLFVGTFLYWLCYIILALGVAIFIPLRINWMRRHADTVALNSARANKLAARKLKKARACLKRGDREPFFDEILAALWGYASDKLKMPGSELNRDNIRDKLTQHGVSQETSDNFIAVIDECEFAKYATGAISMESAYDKASELIKSIDNSFKK